MRIRDMRADSAPTSVTLADDLPITVRVSRSGRRARIVEIDGELDVATRGLVREACLTGRRTEVVVEMAETTFMDCSGYGSLVAARRILSRHGGSLTLRNQTGQPAELLAMLAKLESRN
ncbi:MAG: STAS domain-containing protein [Ilumatobacteraceae bacterium]